MWYHVIFKTQKLKVCFLLSSSSCLQKIFLFFTCKKVFISSSSLLPTNIFLWFYLKKSISLSWDFLSSSLHAKHIFSFYLGFIYYLKITEYLLCLLIFVYFFGWRCLIMKMLMMLVLVLKTACCGGTTRRKVNFIIDMLNLKLYQVVIF